MVEIWKYYSDLDMGLKFEVGSARGGAESMFETTTSGPWSRIKLSDCGSGSLGFGSGLEMERRPSSVLLQECG